MTRLGQTPSQTVGPYFAYGLTPGPYGYPLTDLATPRIGGLDQTEGVRIRLAGRVLDGNGSAVDDAMVELWQCDGAGRYPARDGANAGFTGFARCGTGTDAEARFIFETVKPAAATEEPGQAPHINLVVFARGLLSHLYTRVYFDDEAPANACDPVLASLPEDRRGTLIAAGSDGPEGRVYHFDIHLQGDRETVFFDV
jgi:protocatechuate 3,4-dioxygenase alpha subunit